MRFVVVGNGAREHAFVRRLSVEGHFVAAVHTAPNIGLTRDADVDLQLEKFAPEAVVQFARDQRATIVVGTEEAIWLGVRERADSDGIPCIAPDTAGARLEFDRLYAKNVVRDIAPALVLPVAQIVTESDAIEFVRRFGFPLVLRATRQAGGSAAVERFDSDAQGDFRQQVSKHLAIGHGVLLERAVDLTAEFSVYGLSDGRHHVFPFVVRDYPFLLESDKGPKTGGMGSVSDPSGLVGVAAADVSASVSLMREVFETMAKKVGPHYRGFLVGQFLKTASGLYFNEFDVRPGDSEGINFLHTLGEDCGALLGSIADGALQEPSMHEERVVVCVHHVPPGYPLDNQQRELVLNSDVLQNPQVYIGNLSYGEGEGYRTGFGRTMVTLGQGADVAEAREAAYRVSSLLPAVLRRRSDIGTF